MATYTLGSGIMPASGAVAQQLTDITRPGFLPALVVQTGTSTPLLAMLMANNQSFGGGASQINVPAQFGDMVQTQASDYSGVFSLPSDIPAIQNATFNGKISVTPIPMFGVEHIIQDNYAIVNLMAARMNSAGNNFAAFWNNALYNNYTDNTRLIGLPAAVDNGTFATTYGGISRTSQPAWSSYYRSVPNNTNLTRVETMKHIMNTLVQAGGEKPNCAFVSPATWMSLASDFIGQESFQITPNASFDNGNNGPRSGFDAIKVAGVPIFADIACANGDMWLLNSNYLNLYLHEKLSFALMPFESMLANGQLGYIGAIVNLAELVNTKPSTCGHVQNLNTLS